MPSSATTFRSVGLQQYAEQERVWNAPLRGRGSGAGPLVELLLQFFGGDKKIACPFGLCSPARGWVQGGQSCEGEA
jgi:hypothetical protein